MSAGGLLWLAVHTFPSRVLDRIGPDPWRFVGQAAALSATKTLVPPRHWPRADTRLLADAIYLLHDATGAVGLTANFYQSPEGLTATVEQWDDRSALVLLVESAACGTMREAALALLAKVAGEGA